MPRLTVIFFFIRPTDLTSGNAFDAKREKGGDRLRRGKNAVICPVEG